MSRLARAGLLALAVAFALACPARAQAYRDSDGTLVPGVVDLPFPFKPLAPAQYGVSVSSATALTVPSGARYAVVCAEGATVRYTTSGTTPTSSVGIPLLATSTSAPCVSLYGPAILAAFQAIGSGATIDVEYFQ
jgi:hypothetical protein